MKPFPPPLTTQFDQILGHLEAGSWDQGILQLSGMLDAVMADCSDPAAARASLLDHPLGTVLRSQTGHAAQRQLGFACAAQARADLASVTVQQAWQWGRRCLLISSTNGAELDCLAGRDLAVFDLCPPDQAEAALGTSRGLDLVLAPALADHCDGTALARICRLSAAALVPGGRLVLSAFAPGHLGWGWQVICLGRTLHCHDEAALGSAAAAAGLTARQFRDATGSLIWAELCRPPETPSPRPTPSSTGER